jgi:hypothetical protein
MVYVDAICHSIISHLCVGWLEEQGEGGRERKNYTLSLNGIYQKELLKQMNPVTLTRTRHLAQPHIVP